MIQLLHPGEESLKPVEMKDTKKFRDEIKTALWIDLMNPEREEEEFIEKVLGLNLPSQEEMEEISQSSRLFEENGALYMSCWALCFETAIPNNASVTFVFGKKHFVTIRYSDHHAFRIFHGSRNRLQARRYQTTAGPITELLEAMTGHIASTLRLVEQDLDNLSQQIFAGQKAHQKPVRSVGLKEVVQRLGKRSSMVAHLRESSMSLSLLTPFLMENGRDWIRPELTARLATLKEDFKSLREYDGQLSAEINFLLDSTVGLISIEQNQSIKILSIAAVLVAFI